MTTYVLRKDTSFNVLWGEYLPEKEYECLEERGQNIHLVDEEGQKWYEKKIFFRKVETPEDSFKKEYVWCISPESDYLDYLTKGKKYEVFARDPWGDMIRIYGDDGIAYWLPDRLFSENEPDDVINGDITEEKYKEAQQTVTEYQQKKYLTSRLYQGMSLEIGRWIDPKTGKARSEGEKDMRSKPIWN